MTLSEQRTYSGAPHLQEGRLRLLTSKLAVSALALVMLTACQSTPVQTTATLPELTPLAPEPTPWRLDENNAAVHQPTGGVCPAMIGTFERTDYSVLAIQDRHGEPRYDAICQYLNSDIAGKITAYIYITDGMTLEDEVRGTIEAIGSRAEINVMDDQPCNTRLQLAMALGSIIAAEEAEISPGTTPIKASCIAMELSGATGRTYLGLTENNGWFFKTRATTRLASEDNYQQTDAAMLDFHIQQPAGEN
ncbi:MAG: hypothetical protein CMK07_08265 [Ponticaulis sp.]|nr:hypothetical protein [Ponticaulis sp.]